MTKHELTLAVSQLAARLLKCIYGRGPGRISVSISRNVIMVHALDFQPPVDAYVWPDGGLAAEIHASVIETLMSAISNCLHVCRAAIQLRDWFYDAEFEVGYELIVIVCDQEIRPERIDAGHWEHFVSRLTRAIEGLQVGDASRRERAS